MEVRDPLCTREGWLHAGCVCKKSPDGMLEVFFLSMSCASIRLIIEVFFKKRHHCLESAGEICPSPAAGRAVEKPATEGH